LAHRRTEKKTLQKIAQKIAARLETKNSATPDTCYAYA